MEGATLTIELKDQSSPGAGAGITPQGPATSQQPNLVQEQLSAITEAGGVGAYTRNQQVTQSASIPQVPVATTAAVPISAPISAPITTATQANEANLARFVSDLVNRDPKATAAEIAKTLGAELRQVQGLMNAAVDPVSPGQPAPTVDDTDMLIRRERRIGQEYADSKRKEEDDFRAEAALLIRKERRLKQEEDDKQRQEEEQRRLSEAAKRPPPPPVTAPPQIPGLAGAPPIEAEAVDTSRGVQSTVNMIASLASRGGPLAGAAGQLAASAVAVPGAAVAAGGAMPALISAAPYIAAATAAATIPAAAAYTLNSIAATARGQIQGLSPEVAAAEAESQVRQLIANLGTARRLGDEVSDYINNRSRIGAASQGIRDVVSEPFLKDFNNALFTLTKTAELLNGTAQKNQDTIPNISHAGVRGSLGISTMGLSEIYYSLAAIGNFLKQISGEKSGQGAINTILNITPERPKLPFPFNDSPTVVGPKPIPLSHWPGF